MCSRVTSAEFFKHPRRCWELCGEVSQIEYPGCAPFDDALKAIATEEYRTIIFVYYEICVSNDHRCVPYYTNRRLAGTVGTEQVRWKELLILSRYGIVKKQRALVRGPLPRPFESWPGCFVPKTIAKTNRQKETILKSIESCIKRRMEYKDKCAIPCSKIGKLHDIHDEFIAILQILRAKMIVDMTWRTWR